MAYSEAFARVYDEFTQNVNYKKRAAYLQSLLAQNGIHSGLVLDLACGTGSISVLLSKMGYEVIGVDLSEDMLLRARQKAKKQKQDILFLCQDMTELDLYGTVRAAVCTLDSVNHLQSIEDVQTVFKLVSLFTEPGGVFIFDVNTVYKHKTVLANNSFVYENDSSMLVWQNFFNKQDNSVDILLDVFTQQENGSYQRESEEFTEYAYWPEELTRLLSQAGFTHIKVYGDLSQNEPAKNEQRITFVATK